MIILMVTKYTTVFYKKKKKQIMLHFTQITGIFITKIIKKHNPNINLKFFIWKSEKWFKRLECYIKINFSALKRITINTQIQTKKYLLLKGVGIKLNYYSHGLFFRVGDFNKKVLLTPENVKWKLVKKAFLKMESRNSVITNLISTHWIKLYSKNNYKKRGVFIKNRMLKLKASKLNKS